ncbi:MAG: hypothetical protein GTO02_20050 [Candidatus Dadabacteria bacterium]|nr:hypothetical protein [Candidatus Dadabacteria bacterium]
MNEKYISGFGAGLILISFGVIISYLVASGVENQAAENNQTISFEQLENIHENSYSTIKNSPTSQEFRKFVGDTVDELKDKVVLKNSTLHSELKNSTVVNATE